MLSKRVNFAILAAVLAGIFSVSRFTPTLRAQQTAVEALEKAKVLQRMPEYKAAKGTSPGFVLDPAWPQPLPHHWVIGDIGGIAVDKHDHIWVYHRPRSVSSTDSGMQGATAKDARGRTISDLGFPRPNGQLNGCCMPAPSVLEFDQAGKLLQAWGGPGDPGFLKNKCNPEKNGCTWPASTASTSTRTTSSTLRATAKPSTFTANIPGPRILATIRRSSNLRLTAPSSFKSALRERKAPIATTRMAASTARPSRSGPRTWLSIQKRTTSTSPMDMVIAAS